MSSAITRGGRADQRVNAARGSQGPCGVESPGHPLPLLAVPEEGPGGRQVSGLGAWGYRLAVALAEPDLPLDVLSDGQAVDLGNPGRAGLQGPLARLRYLGMLLGEPPPGLSHDDAEGSADLQGQGGGGVPAFDPGGPGLGGALDRGRAAVLGQGRRVAVAERGDGSLYAVQGAGVPACPRGVIPQVGEGVRGQVLQQRAAVEQERLAEHGGQPLVLAATDAVAPPPEDVCDLLDGAVDRFLAEDRPWGPTEQPLTLST